MTRPAREGWDDVEKKRRPRPPCRGRPPAEALVEPATEFPIDDLVGPERPVDSSSNNDSVGVTANSSWMPGSAMFTDESPQHL